ncbi:MAG: hypothetical protein HDS01_10405 [Bacteroides sp.]|nr:hypothetical protein [Bacteroides sp.]
MEKFITATKETRELITKAFSGISRQTLWRALHFEDINKGTDTERKIRKMALNCGGIVKVVSPECETIHDTTEDGRQIMRQVFKNGATLRVDKKTGETWITNRRGETVVNKQCVSIPQLSEIQGIAENL